MKPDWSISRSPMARADGQRRWDYAYQFLLRWTLEAETSVGSILLPKEEDNQNGNSPLCPCFNQPSTPKPNH